MNPFNPNILTGSTSKLKTGNWTKDEVNGCRRPKLSVLTDLLKFRDFLRTGQHDRPRKDTHTAEQRAENTVWMTHTTIRGIHRIRVVLCGGGGCQCRKAAKCGSSGGGGVGQRDSKKMFMCFCGGGRVFGEGGHEQNMQGRLQQSETERRGHPPKERERDAFSVTLTRNEISVQDSLQKWSAKK